MSETKQAVLHRYTMRKQSDTEPHLRQLGILAPQSLKRAQKFEQLLRVERVQGFPRRPPQPLHQVRLIFLSHSHS